MVWRGFEEAGISLRNIWLWKYYQEVSRYGNIIEKRLSRIPMSRGRGGTRPSKIVFSQKMCWLLDKNLPKITFST